MGVIKPIKFNVESFQEQASWIGGFFSTLNQFINDTVIATSNNLTVSDNLFQEIKEIKFKNTANNFPLKFKTKFNVFPQGVHLIYLYDNTTNDAAIPSVTPYIQWTFNNNDLIIKSISGLNSNSTYTLRVLVING